MPFEWDERWKGLAEGNVDSKQYLETKASFRCTAFVSEWAWWLVEFVVVWAYV